MNKFLICTTLLLLVFCVQSQAQTDKYAKAEGPTTTTTTVQPNGENTNKVEFSKGAFIQKGETKNWEVSFNFVETSRDEWSIYLYDESNNVRIALDLWKKEVKYKGPNDAAYSKLYSIDKAFMSSN